MRMIGGHGGMVAAAAAALSMSGCAGQGRHTSALKEQAQERMAQVKAATQFDMASQQFLAGDLEKASKSIDQSLALNNKVAKSHVLRGRILLEMGRLESALASFDAAVAADAKTPDAHYYRGIVFERFNEYDKALECYRAASALDPGNPQYVIASAEALIDQGRLDEAEAHLNERAAAFRHNAGVRQTLGHLASLRGRHEEASRLFREASLLAPDDASILEDHARSLALLGRFADAEPVLRRLLTRADRAGRRDLALLHARCLIAVDRPVEARATLTRLASDPAMATEPQVWEALADAALLLRDLHQLRQCAQRLIAIAPTMPAGHMYLAKWCLDTGKPAESLEALSRAADLGPTDPTPAVMRGLILTDLGRRDEAGRAFEEALRRDPHHAEARRLLSGLRRSTTDRSSALAGVSTGE